MTARTSDLIALANVGVTIDDGLADATEEMTRRELSAMLRSIDGVRVES